MLSFHVGDKVRIVRKGWDGQKLGVVRYMVAQHYEPMSARYRNGFKMQKQRRYYVQTKDGTMCPFYAQHLKMVEANNHKVRPSTIWTKSPKVKVTSGSRKARV